MTKTRIRIHQGDGVTDWFEDWKEEETGVTVRVDGKNLFKYPWASIRCLEWEHADADT